MVTLVVNVIQNNMITVKHTKDIGLIKSIITNPYLYQLTYGQNATPVEEFKVDQTFTYLLIHEDEKIKGCFQLRELTKVLVEVHIYILPQYWGTDTSIDASFAGFKWLLLNTPYRKVFTDIPEDCTNVIDLVKRVGWKQFGSLDDGVIYNNRLQTLLFYSYNIEV